MGKLDPRLESIFTQALNIADANERAAFVERACGGDEALRREVEAMLQADQGAGGFMKAMQIVNPANAIPSEKSGDRIGHYKLLEQIGEGGFGVVWMAEQEEPVRRRVALKIIKLGMDTRQVVARFEAERQALALMEHPNIAKVFDGGATDTGRPFFVMELVKGIPITNYSDANKLTTRDRLQLFIQVCQAVQHAHQKGIIHRDLKPTNILVTEQDGKPVPMVIDFGVAKATQARLTERTLFTGLHQMIGTPAYMSPEQAGLGALDVDTRSDIYALGVLLYELLTGRTPFTREEFAKAGLDEIFRLIREQDPPKPSTRLSTLTRAELTAIAAQRQSEPAKLNKLLGGDLDWIVMKSLEKDRKLRYETANGLAADVDRHLSGQPVVAAPPTLRYQLLKFSRRHRVAMVTAGAFAVVLAAGTIISVVQALRAQRSAVEAGQQAARASELAEQDRRNLYAARINLAQETFEQGDVTRLGELLDSLRPEPGQEDLRGFEWYYLSRLRSSEQLRLHGSNTRVRAVAFSPDGRLIASGGDDGKARLWDAVSGTQLAVLGETTNALSAVAFSPDEKTLATGGRDRTVRLWDVATHKERATLPELPQDVGAVAFSPDGRWIVAGTAILMSGPGNPATRFFSLNAFNAVVKVWDATSLEEVVAFNAHSAGVLSLGFAPDGKTLVTGSADRQVRVWNIPAGTEQMKLNGVDEYVAAVAFSPDGKVLATAGGDPWRRQSLVKLWDARTGNLLRSLSGHRGPVFALAFASDGLTLASAGLDQVVRLWNPRSGAELRTLKGHSDAIWSLAFDPAGHRLATASWDNTVKVWDAVAPQDFETLTGVEGYCVRFSPDGKRLAASGQSVHLVDLEAGRKKIALPDYRTGDAINAFSPDGRTLATAGMDGLITLWDVASQTKIGVLAGHGVKIWSLAFSPDGRTLASGGDISDPTIRLWNVAERRERALFRTHSSSIACLAFSPDGRSLFAGNWFQLFCLDPMTGEEQWHVDEPSPRLAISPDGSWLAVACMGGQRIRLMDLASKQVRWTIQAHHDIICGLAVSPDRKTLASASWDGTAKLWNVATGQQLLRYDAPGVVWSVAFSPDGLYWAVGSGGAGRGNATIFRAAPRE